MDSNMNSYIKDIKTAVQEIKSKDDDQTAFEKCVLEIEKIFTLMNEQYTKKEEKGGILFKNNKIKCVVEDMTRVSHKTDSHLKSKNEKQVLKDIEYHVNNKTLTGMKLKNAYPNKDIIGISVVGGRGKHYDLVLKLKDKDNVVHEETCELKYSYKYKKIDTSKPPWISGVQFSNGSGSSYIVGREYAAQFYKVLPLLKAHYKIEEPIPSLEEYYSDVMKQGKPITSFVCKLREHGYKTEFLSQFRKDFNKTFKLSEVHYPQLIDEVYKKANESFVQKENWLQIHGSLETPD